MVADAKVVVTVAEVPEPQAVAALAADANDQARAEHVAAVAAARAAADVLADEAEGVKEALWPTRHEITLPLNNINIFFEDYSVTFNQHTNLTADR